MERAAAWESLEHRISGPATVVAFPVRWAAAYAAAAALGFAVWSGAVGNDLFAPEETAEIAALAPPSVVEAPEPRQASTVGPAVAESETASTTPGGLQTVAASTEPVESDAGGFDTQVPATAIAARATPSRYQLDPAWSRTVVPAETVAFAQGPEIVATRTAPIAVQFLRQGLVLQAPEPRGRPAEEPPTLVAAQAVIEGHWALYRAQVWREDISPAWTQDGLVFRGTVENEQVRETVRAAIRAARKDRDVPVELTVRNVTATANLAPAAGTPNQGVLGGVVRTSLMEHFDDAARRSFVSTEPTALEGELDRFVNNVFESQSRLLSHAYKLNGLVRAVPAELLPQLVSSSRFSELVSTHANEVRREQSRIYDLLSEALPRKYWTYQAKEDDTPSGGPRAEAQALLQGALELDANLTALLSTPQSLLDAGDDDISCGEALSRIRSRSNRIKAATR